MSELAAALARMTPSNPANPDSVVGPVINEPAHTAVTSAIELAVADGGRVLAGGSPCRETGGLLSRS